MISSFRLRMALLSALLAGLALAAFGFGSWWLIRGLKLERIDAEVRAQAERGLQRIRNTQDWNSVESRLAIDVGARDTNELLLLVQSSTGEDLYRSAHWPGGLVTEQLAWPTKRSGEKTGAIGLSLISSAMAQPAPGAGQGDPADRPPPPFGRPFPNRRPPVDEQRGAPPPHPNAPQQEPQAPTTTTLQRPQPVFNRPIDVSSDSPPPVTRRNST
jgi:hypothetical protein